MAEWEMGVLHGVEHDSPAMYAFVSLRSGAHTKAKANAHLPCAEAAASVGELSVGMLVSMCICMCCVVW